jgi:hypothetical protein
VRKLARCIFHDFERGWTWIFRLLTLLSVGYLVADRKYETEATINIVASDENYAFLFPFSINNNSHIFPIYNINWVCAVIEARGEKIKLDYVSAGNGTKSEIDPRRNLNIGCNIIGKNSNFINTSIPTKFSSIELLVSLQYDMKIFGYSWTITPKPTLFTWLGISTKPQWIRGEFAQ